MPSTSTPFSTDAQPSSSSMSSTTSEKDKPNISSASNLVTDSKSALPETSSSAQITSPSTTTNTQTSLLAPPTIATTLANGTASNSIPSDDTKQTINVPMTMVTAPSPSTPTTGAPASSAMVTNDSSSSQSNSVKNALGSPLLNGKVVPSSSPNSPLASPKLPTSSPQPQQLPQPQPTSTPQNRPLLSPSLKPMSGTASPSTETTPRPEKPSVKDRLSRMFSSRDSSKSPDLVAATKRSTSNLSAPPVSPALLPPPAVAPHPSPSPASSASVTQESTDHKVGEKHTIGSTLQNIIGGKPQAQAKNKPNAASQISPSPSSSSSSAKSAKSESVSSQKEVEANGANHVATTLTETANGPVEEKLAIASPLPSEPSSAATTPGPSRPPSRKGAREEDGAATPKTSRASSLVSRSRKSSNAKEPALPRFVILPEGCGHEHNLKQTRRQEKLSDMWRGFLGGGKKDMEAVGGAGVESGGELSLLTGWLQNLKHDRDLPGQRGADAMAFFEKYGKCQEVVGRGAFGIVRISHKKLDNNGGEKLFAVKEFRRRPEESERKYSKRLTSEFCISSSLRHPNVIHTLDLLKDAKGAYCEVMEFCAGGDLYTLVLAVGKLDTTEADCFFKQLMRGVSYLHDMGVAHRDLKPENLLLTTSGVLKITDFGNGECFRMAWEKDAHMVSGLCGSAPYIAPEEYTESEFDARAVDVWACGVIYMAMRTGRHLWRVAKVDDDEFYERYLEGRRGEDGYGPIESLSRARCRNVIYSILDPNPERRLTARQVLKSEWGREIVVCDAGEQR